MKNATIKRISRSPSGQIVAHVEMDNGEVFQYPFGPEMNEVEIVQRCQAEVDSRLRMEAIAKKYHEFFVGAGQEVVKIAQQMTEPRTVSLPKPSRTKRLWVILSWYFRRKK